MWDNTFATDLLAATLSNYYYVLGFQWAGRGHLLWRVKEVTWVSWLHNAVTAHLSVLENDVVRSTAIGNRSVRLRVASCCSVAGGCGHHGSGRFSVSQQLVVR